MGHSGGVGMGFPKSWQQVEGLVSTSEVPALFPRRGRDGEISSAMNSLLGSWMGMQALETPQIPGGWNQDSPGAHLSGR